MLIYTIRRLLQTIPVIIGVTIIVFLLMHLIPGTPPRPSSERGLRESR